MCQTLVDKILTYNNESTYEKERYLVGVHNRW